MFSTHPLGWSSLRSVPPGTERTKLRGIPAQTFLQGTHQRPPPRTPCSQPAAHQGCPTENLKRDVKQLPKQTQWRLFGTILDTNGPEQKKFHISNHEFLTFNAKGESDDINSTKQLKCIWEYPTKLSMKLWAWRQAKERYYIEYLRHEATDNTLGIKEKITFDIGINKCRWNYRGKWFKRPKSRDLHGNSEFKIHSVAHLRK